MFEQMVVTLRQIGHMTMHLDRNVNPDRGQNLWVSTGGSELCLGGRARIPASFRCWVTIREMLIWVRSPKTRNIFGKTKMTLIMNLAQYNITGPNSLTVTL